MGPQPEKEYYDCVITLQKMDLDLVRQYEYLLKNVSLQLMKPTAHLLCSQERVANRSYV